MPGLVHCIIQSRKKYFLDILFIDIVLFFDCQRLAVFQHIHAKLQPKVEVKEEVECSEVLKEEAPTEGVGAWCSYDNIGKLCDDACVKT